MLAALMILIVLFAFGARTLDRKIAEIAEIKCREQAERIITSSVEETISEMGSVSLYSFIKDDKGKPVSAEIDPVSANRIRTLLISKVEKRLHTLCDEGFEIPLGTLTGISLLSGKGIGLNVDVMQTGTAESRFDSTFEDAGINNVKLKVTVKVSVMVRIILPSGSRDITAEGEYLIAETVFIADAPNMYF